jgi:hypothetical protein
MPTPRRPGRPFPVGIRPGRQRFSGWHDHRWHHQLRVRRHLQVHAPVIAASSVRVWARRGLDVFCSGPGAARNPRAARRAGERFAGAPGERPDREFVAGTRSEAREIARAHVKWHCNLMPPACRAGARLHLGDSSSFKKPEAQGLLPSSKGKSRALKWRGVRDSNFQKAILPTGRRRTPIRRFALSDRRF